MTSDRSRPISMPNSCAQPNEPRSRLAHRPTDGHRIWYFQHCEVTWSVQEGNGGGTVNTSGLYTAPSVPITYHVVAKSKADPTQTVIATIIVRTQTYLRATPRSKSRLARKRRPRREATNTDAASNLRSRHEENANPAKPARPEAAAPPQLAPPPRSQPAPLIVVAPTLAGQTPRACQGATIALSLFTDRALLWFGALLYLAGFLTGLAALTRRQSPTGLRTLLNTFLVGGWVFQMIGLYVRGLAVGGCPLGNKFEIVQFVAWSAMALYFFVGTAFRLSVLGLFTAGYAATLSLVSLLIGRWDLVHGGKIFGPNPWIELHAALAVFSYGVFGLLALTSLMHLLQNWSLKLTN